jgi:hypothetical protein
MSLEKIVDLIGRLFSLLLVGTFVAAAIKSERYLVAGGLVIVFLFLLKVKDIDYFKISKDSIEVKDDESKN